MTKISEGTDLPVQTDPVAPAPPAPASQAQFNLIDLDSAQNIPDLESAQPLAVELVSEYWEPELEGETKRLVFSHMDNSLVPSRDNPDLPVELKTAFFYEKTKDGGIKSIRQASTLLVSAIMDNQLQRGTPVIVTYIGIKKFKNGNKGHNWSVKPLVLTIA